VNRRALSFCAHGPRPNGLGPLSSVAGSSSRMTLYSEPVEECSERSEAE